MGDNNDKKTGAGSKIDRLIMGVILGGAIGSVLGLTLAPRKGAETREIIKDKSKELLEKGKEVSTNFVRDHKETFESAKYQIKKGRGFFRWLFGSKKKSREQMPRQGGVPFRGADGPNYGEVSQRGTRNPRSAERATDSKSTLELPDEN